MSDNITIVKQDNNVTVTETVNQVVLNSVGLQGPKGSSIYRQAGAPSNDLGNIGDYYIDSDTKNFYGPKTSSGWGQPVFVLGGNSIIVGSTVPSSSLGSNGDIYIETITNTVYTKVAGTWGNGQPLVNPSNFSYVYEQQTNSSTWYINHNLHYRPNVQVTDYGQNNLECDITQIDANNVELEFNTPVSGYAYLS